MGRSLLYLQLFLFFLLLAVSHPFVVFGRPMLLFLFLLGSVVGLSGVFHVGSSFSPYPEPTKTNILSQKGIYRVLRHPMYSGLALVGLSLFLSNPTLGSGITWVLFLVVLNAKANVEEKLLMKMHPEYAAYRKRVKKFIPFVY